MTQNQIYDDEAVRNVLSAAKIPKGIYITTELPKGIYIHVNLIHETGDRRTSRRGLDIALEQLQTAQVPIVLYSFESPHSLFSDRRFMEALSHQSVHFLRLPLGYKQIREYVGLPTFQNPALEIAASAQEQTDLLKTLRHDYRHNPQETVERARSELGIGGSDKEIEGLLQDYESEMPQGYSGHLPGIFCDVEGTLLHDGEINTDLVSQLIQYARQHPVTLWTGGDVKILSGEVSPQLEKICEACNRENGQKTNLHLRTPVLSKHLFRGSQPEIVFDDMTLNAFKAEYGINPQQYIQIQ